MANIYIDRITQEDTMAMQHPHNHTHYELYFLQKGNRLYLLDDVSFNVSARSIVVVPPLLRHMTSGGDFERTLIRVFPQILTPYQISVLENLFQQKAYHPSSSTLENLEVCFQQMFAISETDPFYEDQLLAVFSYLIYLLETDMKEHSPTPVEQKKVPLLIYQIIEYIDQNYSQKISLEGLALHFNYSISNLERQFRKYYSYSLYDYILALRIEKAKNLLATTPYKMEKIAEQCGFPSANYFSLIFKRKTGMPPLFYKKLIKS